MPQPSRLTEATKPAQGTGLLQHHSVMESESISLESTGLWYQSRSVQVACLLSK